MGAEYPTRAWHHVVQVLDSKETLMRRCLRFLTVVAVFTVVVSGDLASHSSAQATVGRTDAKTPELAPSGDAAIVTFLIKPDKAPITPDKTTDFGRVLSRLMEAYHRATTPSPGR